MVETAKDCLAEGRLTDSVELANEEVRKHPADLERRAFLADLLCVAGNLDRADKQLEIVQHQDPSTAVGLSLLRQIIRADMARTQFYQEGRVPEFLSPPSQQVQLHLRAAISNREKRDVEAANLLAEAEGQRRAKPGRSDGTDFDDFRDLDDLLAPVFEVLTSTGKYYWVDVESVAAIEFRKPVRTRDLLWRRAQLTVRGGPEGEVYIPATYWLPPEEKNDSARLGRFTEWQGGDGRPVRGVGLRSFLVGDQAQSILELTRIEFAADQTP